MEHVVADGVGLLRAGRRRVDDSPHGALGEALLQAEDDRCVSRQQVVRVEIWNRQKNVYKTRAPPAQTAGNYSMGSSGHQDL